MKTAYFTLSDPTYDGESTRSGFWRKWATYRIPILPAYAIASYTIQGIKTSVDGDVTSVDSDINEDIVTVHGVDQITHMLSPPESTLIINYLGIRDYQAFFPCFEDLSLKARAAEFMEEADKTFDEGVWLSFVLMAGGVLESFLVDLTGDKRSTFGGLITKVKDKEYFSELEMEALHEASSARNIVHAGKYNKPYVSRDKAMTVRLALEQLLRKDWEQIKSNK